MSTNANNAHVHLTRDTATFLAVTLHSSSPFMNDPAQLAGAHSALTHMGQVGEMKDIQLVAVPNLDWANVGEDVVKALKTKEGVVRVDVQGTPKTRPKRDEF